VVLSFLLFSEIESQAVVLDCPADVPPLPITPPAIHFDPRTDRVNVWYDSGQGVALNMFAMLASALAKNRCCSPYSNHLTNGKPP
jgi:hypothetical protein